MFVHPSNFGQMCPVSHWLGGSRTTCIYMVFGHYSKHLTPLFCYQRHYKSPTWIQQLPKYSNNFFDLSHFREKSRATCNKSSDLLTSQDITYFFNLKFKSLTQLIWKRSNTVQECVDLKSLIISKHLDRHSSLGHGAKLPCSQENSSQQLFIVTLHVSSKEHIPFFAW